MLRPVRLDHYEGTRFPDVLSKPEEGRRAVVGGLLRRHPGQGLRALPFALLPASLRQRVEQPGADPELTAGLTHVQGLAAEFEYPVKFADGGRDAGEEVQRT